MSTSPVTGSLVTVPLGFDYSPLPLDDEGESFEQQLIGRAGDGDIDALDSLERIQPKPTGYDELVSSLYSAALTQRNAVAMMNIGTMYEQGIGVAQDPVQAIDCYAQAAGHGDTDAMNMLGTIYEKGMICEKDIEAAKSYYLAAANLGNRDAMFNLALLHTAEGELLAARELYQEAADEGCPSAMVNLGLLYHDEGDSVGAIALYRRAAEAGDAYAMYNLGGMYEDGEGVEQSRELATEWYRQAATLGDEDARARLTELSQGVVPES